MRHQPSTTQRTNRAFRIAYWTDVQRIYYTATLTAFLHTWAIYVIDCLIPSAITVLQFFAALHRSSRNGYIGTAVAYELLAPQVARATGRKCSERTLRRGLQFLRTIGLVNCRRWAMPDFRSSSGATVTQGTQKKQIGAREWRSTQLSIWTLSDRAIALWDKSTKLQAKRYIPLLPTPAKLAARSQQDQVENSTMVKVSTSDDQTSTEPRQSMSDCDPSIKTSSPDCAARDTQGQSTRPDVPRTGRPTLEHQTSTSTPQSPAPSVMSEGSEREAYDKASPSAESNPISPSTGCSEERPGLPKKPKNPHAWNIGQIFILNELHKALTNFSNREADTIYSRARFEMSRDFPSGWPTSVDWSYWVPRFATFPPPQRRNDMFSQILPLLKHPAVICPDEPTRYKSGTTDKREKPSIPIDPFIATLEYPEKYDEPEIPGDPTPMNSTLVPFLQNLMNKFGTD